MKAFNILSNSLATAALLVVTAGCGGAAGSKSPDVVVKYVREFDATGTPNVVATMNGEEVKDADLRANPDIRMQLFNAEQNVWNAQRRAFDVYKEATDKYIEEKLTTRAASEAKMSVEDLMKKEVDAKIRKVSDKELKKFYDEKKIERPFDTIKDRIREYLENQERDKAREVFVAGLRKKYKVESKLAEFQLPKPLPPRVEVPSAEGAATKGNAGAPITIVEFSDYQCPYCKKGEESVKEVLKKYGSKIRLEYRHFPLAFHQDAGPAAQAAECAKEQGKFWEYHAKLFDNQQALKSDDLTKYAAELKLDAAKFKECVDSKRHEATVNRDIEAGKKLGVNGTPAFFVNGRMLSGARGVEDFAELIEADLQGQSAKPSKG